jgi:hypothetical protein
MNDVASNEILNALNELESMAVKKENKFFKSTVKFELKNIYYYILFKLFFLS